MITDHGKGQYISSKKKSNLIAHPKPVDETMITSIVALLVFIKSVEAITYRKKDSTNCVSITITIH